MKGEKGLKQNVKVISSATLENALDFREHVIKKHVKKIFPFI